MSIHEVLHDILSLDTLSIPKPGKHYVLGLPTGFPTPMDVDPTNVYQAFGELVEDFNDMWRVMCTHRCNPGAREAAIQQAEVALGFALPQELHSFLRLANGAELFVVRRLGLETVSPGTFHVRYKLFDTDDLVTQNKQAFDSFRYVLGTDPDFEGVQKLNYVSFCDVGDGNYLAILLEGVEKGKAFFLDREGFFRPYSELDQDMYVTLADSLEKWLILLHDTGGWAGRGMMIGGF